MTPVCASASTRADVQRDYIREHSRALGRDMELLHFGHAGRPLLVFPTSMGRFYRKFYAGRNPLADFFIYLAILGKLAISVVRSAIARRSFA